MSHFTVMVFGDNPDKLLAPYDENLDVPKYLVGEVSEDEQTRFLAYYSKEDDVESDSLTFKELYEKYGDEWNGGSWEFEDGKVLEYSTYNPKSKWDWYQIGGRWTGYFKLKKDAIGALGSSGAFGNEPDEGTADILRKKDIDIEGMREVSEREAAEAYDKIKPIIDEFGDGFIPWEESIKKFDDPDEARKFYHSQPLIKVLSERRNELRYFIHIEDFLVSREEYLQRARDNAISPYAFVTPKGEWIEKGKMGWFGISSDEKDQDEWDKVFSDYFDNLPDDVIVTLVDCHI